MIEGSGIAEPLPIASTFAFRDADGQALEDVARLDTMVTVVDAINLLRDLGSHDALADRGETAGAGDERKLADLLTGQIEFADVIIINKADDVADEQRGLVRRAVRALNPDAQVAVPEAKWPANPDWRDMMMGYWMPTIGDRRQEMVFIGIDMDKEKMRRALDACLLPVEHKGGDVVDPFPVWSNLV